MKKLITAVSALTFLGLVASSVYADNHGHQAKDIVATAADNAQFSTLVAAVQAAELVEALQGEGPFTVFAPTNAAFDALPEGTVASLLEEENRDTLVAVLTYHVVSGQVMSGDIPDGVTEVPTLQGTTLRVEKTASGVTVNGANVTSVDIETSNGVIHVIDAVVIPGQ
jgi:uncharacterized surface protein with fasciclin (FAS1) repeats